jgi:hypothetical protein
MGLKKPLGSWLDLGAGGGAEAGAAAEVAAGSTPAILASSAASARPSGAGERARWRRSDAAEGMPGSLIGGAGIAVPHPPTRQATAKS